MSPCIRGKIHKQAERKKTQDSKIEQKVDKICENEYLSSSIFVRRGFIQIDMKIMKIDKQTENK